MEQEKYQITGFDDIERKNFMYAPFSANKNVNPRHWDSKIQFWSNEILRSCRFYADICVTCEKLKERFCGGDDKRKPSGMFIYLFMPFMVLIFDFLDTFFFFFYL